MSDIQTRKIFAGGRIRRLRRDLGLTQAQMAEGLGVSPSYLNLVERDQRPLSAQLILKLSKSYDVNLKTFAADDSTRIHSDLQEVFADPLLESTNLTPADLVDLARNSGAAAQAIVMLYRAYRQQVERTANIADHIEDVNAVKNTNLAMPVDEVRDFYVSNKSYFHELEVAAETLWETTLSKSEDLSLGLRRHLRGHGVTVKIMPSEHMNQFLYRFDRHSSRLFLSDSLNPSTQRFQIAMQIALMEHSGLINEIIAREGFRHDDTRRLLRIALSNYFAAAVLMPYEQFLRTAEKKRYDIQLLCQRFEVSYEQACHRLTTLQRPGAQGVEFFFVRIDRAGNISKRLSATGFYFTRFGGACPRWNVHEVFRNPGRIITQLVQMPDKSAYLSISRTVEGVQTGYHGSEIEHAIGLGCNIRDASKTIYADGYDLSDDRLLTPIGPNCRLCERPACAYRAFPPINRALVIDENLRGISPFLFKEID